MLILVFRIYSLTVAVTLLLEMLTTLRSQIHGIPLEDYELITTIVLAIIKAKHIVLNSTSSCNEYAPSTIMLYITDNILAIISIIISFILFPPSNYILVLFLTNVN